MSAVYETVRDIVRHSGFDGFDEATNPVAPGDQDLEAAFAVAARWWDSILRMRVLQPAMNDPSQVPFQRFDADHEAALLLRPTGQIAFVRGLTCALDADASTSPAELISRATAISRRTSADSIWRGSLLLPDGRISARKEAVALAAELVAYLLVGQQFEVSRRDRLERAWNRACVGASMTPCRSRRRSDKSVPISRQPEPAAWASVWDPCGSQPFASA